MYLTRSTLRRWGLAIVAVANLGLAFAIPVAESRAVAESLLPAGRSHAEDTSGATCPAPHLDDCGFCRMLSTPQSAGRERAPLPSAGKASRVAADCDLVRGLALQIRKERPRAPPVG